MNEAVEKELFPVEESDPETPEPETHPVEDSGDTDTDVDASEKPAVVEKEAPDVVPLAALLEERNSWKKEREEFKTRLAEVEKVKEALAEWQRRNEEAQKPPVPEFDADPAGNLDYRTKQMQEEFKRLQERLEKTDQSQQQQRVMQEVGQMIGIAEQQFVQDHPDYQDALRHVRNIELQKIKLAFPDIDDQSAMNKIYQDELQASAFWLNQRRNPAEVIYQMAQNAYGYKKAEPETGELEKLEKGVKQSRSLGSGTGAKKVEDFTEKSTDELLEYLNYATADLIRR